MTALPVQRSAAAVATRSISQRTLWGLDAVSLCRRYWRAMGYHAVVRGSNSPGPDDRGPFVLLHDTHLVLGDSAQCRRMARDKWTGVVRVRDRTQASYHETIELDESHLFQRVTRTYQPEPGVLPSVFLTSDPNLACSWADAPDARRAWLAVKAANGWTTRNELVVNGLVIDANDEDALELLLLAFDRAGCSPDGRQLVKAEPGIWIHPTAVVGRGVEFIGPAWIGAGQVLIQNDVVVGPCVLEDVIETSMLGDQWLTSTPPDTKQHAVSSETFRELSGERLFNILAAALGLLVTLPLYPIIMALIFIEDGRPWFFGHRRQTRGGGEFDCLKFRTMCRDAERKKNTLEKGNASDGPHFHMPEDPRLLRVGRWMRRFHLDELPQLINVLRGEMNLVGPRPSPDGENQYCPGWREARLGVRPGLTGLWQVCRTRHPGLDFQEWIRFDLEYVRCRSWRLDLWILAMTVVRVLAPGGRKES